MPSPMTSSFAAAAAGSNGESTGSRRDNNHSSEWSRNRPNGATQTFRRTSTNASSARDSPSSSGAGAGVYIPPHLNSSNQPGGVRNGGAGESRYSKDQLLDIYQAQKETGTLSKNLEDIFTGSWHPTNSRIGISASWNARGDGKEAASGPEVCWDYDAGGEPLGLADMTEEEKSLFMSSVNSPLKLPQANAKDNAGGSITGGRKSSLSHLGGSGVSTNTAGRPGSRRRETSDSFSTNGPLSPTGARQSYFRDDPTTNTPPAALLRRRTDFKDDTTSDEARDRESQSRDSTGDSETPFGGLKRSTTGPLSTGLNGPSSSPWSTGPQNSAFGPMGAFGSFAVGSSPLMQDSGERRPGFGSGRGGSRFKDLLSKASGEDMSPAIKQKMSLGNLENLLEDDMENRLPNSTEGFQTRRDRSETNPYEDATLPRSGSAALGGSQDIQSQGIEHLGFSSFGQRDMGPTSAYNQTPHGRSDLEEPMSPTNTNPYQSPHGNRGDDGGDADESESQPNTSAAFNSLRRNMAPGSDDRGQSSGAIGGRGLTGLGGMGGFPSIGGGSTWSAGGMTSGTPGRERNAVSSPFGDHIFGQMSDLQSPSLVGAGTGGFFGAAGLTSSSSMGRANKLGPLFPPAMQEQMRSDGPGSGFGQDAFQAASRDPFDGSSRRRDDPAYRGNLLESTLQSRQSEDNMGPFSPQAPFGQSSTAGPTQTPITVPASGQRMSTASDNAAGGQSLSQSSGSPSTKELPTTQQRTMVMPDRMRWIYRDPQGNTQGPWSGLEMHDWFKAGFFTAELQVKKLEDAEYEPLAQLVRRIGNSREPFLVPQIGVPHGPPASNPTGNHWASPTVPGASAAAPNNNPQPPFASAFPSFGTTLTAEQQNALERRKQEEQFLMARQKEHLAQQQVMMKQMQLQTGPHGLHSLQHHSSAHSLHSQPSFGSITSPSAYQPSPMQGPIQPPQAGPAFLDSVMRQPPTSNMGHPILGSENRGREDELHSLVDRPSFNQRTMFAPSSTHQGSQHQENVAAILQDRARLQSEQQQADMRTHRDAFLGQAGQSDRLSEFQGLRGTSEFGHGQEYDNGQPARPIGAPGPQESRAANFVAPGAIGHPATSSSHAPGSSEESLSLTQQVQRAAASQAPANGTESSWNKFDYSDSAPAPPPVSISPLPAPAAQRNRQHVADALAAESRSNTQTPIETPSTSVAPWADKSSELAKGPSLKEIQEAEARQAAEQEEIAAAARRAQAEQERVIQPVAPAPGLPASSTWGNSVSPATPTGPAASVWVKGSSGKPATSSTNGSTKKTLAQIQKEEESRKQRAAAAAAAAGQASSAQPAAATGKRYAELASKIVSATPATPTGAWTTVGQGGAKAKAPATVVAAPPTAARTVSGTAAVVKARPSLQATRSTASVNQNKALDEFMKWTKSALSKGLNNNINLDTFVQVLLACPPEIEIISDSVYANSETLDGRRFAEEFLRRKKLADKGIIDPATAATPQSASADNKSAGGWSEVAKKGPAPKEESTAAFKVVSKKKGKR